MIKEGIVKEVKENGIIEAIKREEEEEESRRKGHNHSVNKE